MKVDPKYSMHLRTGIKTEFSLEEIKNLCDDLGIDFEDLGGEGKEGKARELIAFCLRRTWLDKLVGRCEELRPQFPWRDPNAPIPSPDPFPPPTPFNLENSIVAILGDKNKILGTGFVIAGPLIVTCAHVMYKMAGPIAVRPHTHQQSYLTDIVALSSAQPKSAGQKDVAILRPRNDFPPLPTLTLRPGLALQDRGFVSFGYPEVKNIRGLRARGEIRGSTQDVAGTPILQLISQEIAQGMSGAPVLDEMSQQVVGMISDGLTTHKEAKLRDLVLAVPTEIVQEFLPGSKPLRRENPFYVSGRINDATYFFGREREIREIQGELRKHLSVSIVGPSQIGKSSLLYNLYHTAANWLADTRTIYLDLQSVLDEADFCAEILRHLGQEGDSLRQLKNALRQGNLLLFLDETERLAESDFNPRLHDLLRSLTQEPHFALCLASQRPLVDVFPSRNPGGLSPFHNIFVEKSLGPFSQVETRTFLAQQLADTPVQFKLEEIDNLFHKSQGHPAQLQRLARSLFERYINQIN